MRILKLWTFIILIAALAASAFLWFFSFPKSIDVEYPAVEFRNHQTSTMEKTTVRIKGVLKRPLFRNEKFSGSVSIAKYDYTKQEELVDIVFYKNIRNGFAPLTYSNFANGIPTLKLLGNIRKGTHFEQVKISVYEPIDADSKMATDLIVVGPAQTLEEAQRIADQLVE